MRDGDLPPGWAKPSIEQLITSDGVFVDGDWVESKDQDPQGDIRLIQLADIGEGAFLNKSSRFLTSAKASELRCTFLEKDDVLVARMPDPLGRACIFPLEGQGRYVTVVDVCIIRTSRELASPEFLTSAINYLGTRKQIEELQTGTTRKRISRGNLATVTIPLPPLAEQKRIVAKIEELFSELEAGEESLRVARRQLGVYRQSLLKQAFEGKLTGGWRTLKVGEIGRIETGTTPPTANPNNYDGDLPFLKPTDLEQGRFVRKAREHLSEAGQEHARVLPKGSVLVTCIGATIGKTGLAQLPCATNQQINSISPNEEVLPEFAYYQVISPRFQEQIKTNASSTTLPILNKSKFCVLPFVVCSLPEQREIVRLLDEQFEVIERNEREIDAALRRSEVLRQAILKKAFTGQLVPQDPADEPASELLSRLRAEKEKGVATKSRSLKKQRARRTMSGGYD